MFPRHRTAALLLGALCLLAVASAQNKTDEPPKTTDAKKLDLAKLPNDELLKQADAIYARGSGDYLAAVRSLAGAEAQLDDAVKQLADLAPPKPATGKSDAPGEDGAKSAVDAAKARADFAKEKLKLTQTRKALQEKVLSGVEGVQSAAI